MEERRKYIRIPESLEISYEVMPKPKTRDNITRDIGQGGIRFFVYEFIPKDSLLKIRVNIKKITFSFEALVKLIWISEVPHSEKYEIGVEFMNLPENAAGHLIGYITNLIKPNQ